VRSLVLCWAALLCIGTQALAESFGIQPPTAHVTLRGPVTLSGWDPLTVDELLDGEYELFAGGTGLVQARGWVTRYSGGWNYRRWAGPTALIYPSGFAHIRRGDPRGWTFFMTGVSGGIAWAFQQHELGKSEDRLEDAEARLDAAITPDEIEDAMLDVSLQKRSVDDEGRIRDIWVGYTAASWLMAGVEAWLFTPKASFNRGAEGAPSLRVPERSAFVAGLQSLLVPGAGQRALGHHTRASYFMLGVVSGGMASIFGQEYFLEARRELTVAEERLELADTDTERSRARSELNDAEDYYDRKNMWRWIFIGTTAAIYTWNVVDAVRLGAEASPAGSAWRVFPTTNGVAVQFAWGGP